MGGVVKGSGDDLAELALQRREDQPLLVRTQPVAPDEEFDQAVFVRPVLLNDEQVSHRLDGLFSVGEPDGEQALVGRVDRPGLRASQRLLDRGDDALVEVGRVVAEDRVGAH